MNRYTCRRDLCNFPDAFAHGKTFCLMGPGAVNFNADQGSGPEPAKECIPLPLLEQDAVIDDQA